ncbi:protein-export membrane protein SecD [Candidatus Woesebacteria bacterium RIFCSPHIGHO2_01_FULL_41_10]|uniref:Protein translocase subunit SecD n=1 Tax=Candidatus Woesebacteria bacterium RIFCSPHIGHO2_01_FULL_41_10 TaxID=1802500 RepID=A0A1F7YR67_9BACT|nr:MAG: protein-export membrane protein SecD [Candidatus Woesebacteria bacterium RIFCSPHIGHO2_01_FULL_41_10]
MQVPSRKRLFIILVLSFLAFFIILPRELSLNIDTPISIHQTLVKPGIHISFGNVEIHRDLDIKLGLDLRGGSHLAFEAQTEDLSEPERETALTSLIEVISQRVNLYGVSEPSITLATFEGVDRVIVDLPGVSDTKEAIDLIGKTAQLVFAEVDTENESLIPTDLTGADIKQAQVGFDNVSAEPIVSIEFTDEGAAKFEAVTERNVGKNVAIVLDDQVISAPIVNEKIIGGKAQISGLGGEDALDQAQLLAVQINAGALPVSINLVQESVIGPTLGETSIQQSVRAGVIGLIAVMIIMVVFYRKLGLVASLALLLFGLYTLAIYKLVPVVLTLPGIAGFLLSVGMAVDSNILIFERFREERAKGASITFSLETAFGRAWDSIRDANIATLTAAFILANPFGWAFLHTSGPVRGFAITLAIGVGISLFTGVYVSRNLLRYFIRDKEENI